MIGTTTHRSQASIQNWLGAAYQVATYMHRFNEPAPTLSEVAP